MMSEFNLSAKWKYIYGKVRGMVGIKLYAQNL